MMKAGAFDIGCQFLPSGNEGDGPLPAESLGAFPSPSCSPVATARANVNPTGNL